VDCGQLIERVYSQLDDNRVYYLPSEVVDQLNVAQRMLVLLKPDLLTRRTAVSLVADEVFIDLRVQAPRCTRVQRVVLGDVSGDDPILTQGKTGELRRHSLTSLRSQRDWFRVRKPVASHWYPHGLYWVCTWPRATQAITVTVIYRTTPMPLALAVPTQVPDMAAPFHPLISDIAAQLCRCKEGANDVEQAIEGLSKILGEENFQGVRKQMQAEARRQQYAGTRTTA
jgi:hypothetical protein